MSKAKPSRGTQPPAEQTATLMTHVRELQIRLLVTAVVLVGAGVVAYLYYAQILNVLRAPLNAPLYYNSVSGSFSFVMKICMVAGIAVSVPLIVYNFIMFVRPAFIEVFTIKRAYLMTVGSVVAAVCGVLFAFLFVIPGALHFFGGFKVEGLNELISADSYLNFVINTLITFIIMFQLPIIVSLIDRIKPISPKAMLKGEKWALLGSLIVSFLVPFAMDFMTQFLIAAPIFLLYNISFVIVLLQSSYRKKLQKKAVRVEARVERRAQRVAKRGTGPTGSRPAPVAAANLAPHPQLAEVFALQAAHDASPKTAAAKRVKPVAMKPAPQQTSRLVHHVAKPAPVVQPIQPTMNHRPIVSMDGMSRPSAAHRSHPAQVIRQAGTIQAPQRPGAGVRPAPQMASMRFLSDIR